MYRVVYYRDIDDKCVEVYVGCEDLVDTIDTIYKSMLTLVSVNYLEVIRHDR